MEKFDNLVESILEGTDALDIGDIRIFNKKDKKYGGQLEQNNPFTIEEIQGNGGDVTIKYQDSGRTTSIPGQIVVNKSKIVGKEKDVKAVKNANGYWIKG